MPSLERENILSVDPKRCRPWKYHNRTDAWYTRERCQDLIDSIAKDGQLEPALARRLEGEKDYDFELIFGMRRRFACEATGQKLKVRVVEADDARAAVLMHIENADRQDITPMERAISFATQVEAKVFATQEALAAALGVSTGQVAKMVKAAGLLKASDRGRAVPGSEPGAGRAGLPGGGGDGTAGGEGGGAAGGDEPGAERRGRSAADGDPEGTVGEPRPVEKDRAHPAGIQLWGGGARGGDAQSEGEGEPRVSEGCGREGSGCGGRSVLGLALRAHLRWFRRRSGVFLSRRSRPVSPTQA
jgi:ParB/RepB/Spo0J family partition protein